MQFLRTLGEGWTLSGHPGWRIGDTPGTSRLLTAEELIDHGYGILVKDAPPAFDPATQRLSVLGHDKWRMDTRYAYRTYEVADIPPPTREEMPPLSARQIRLALASIGIAEPLVDAKLVEDPLGTIEWKHATEFRRTHPLVLALGASFALPEEQIDDLWRWAAAL
ncbi:hypothetical protein [Aquibium microcysteis]|uniref:hypothetical protein n=1 Tax=Aquibium microcysteis TaxID=675281 RepID=UPI00165CF449|nr:hypothetical protein [Aquibium microcysteis]